VRTSLSDKRQAADKMLAYLKQHNIATCNNTYTMLCEIAEATGETIYVLWKAYSLLRTMARIQLNSLNGKSGFHVLDYTPISSGLADRPNARICEVSHCPILKALKNKFPESWEVI